MIYIIATILFFAFLMWEVSHDYERWKENLTTYHKKGVVRRAIYLTPVLILFQIAKQELKVSLIIVTALMLACTWWFLFDGLYNLKRGFAWGFKGSVDKDESVLDNVTRAVPMWVVQTVKAIFMATTIFIYTKL